MSQAKGFGVYLVDNWMLVEAVKQETDMVRFFCFKTLILVMAEKMRWQ